MHSGLVERYGVEQQFARDEVGYERLSRRHLRGARRAVHKRERYQVPYLGAAAQHQKAEYDIVRHIHREHSGQYAPPVKAVGQIAGERGYQDAGYHRGECNHAYPVGRVRNLIDNPAARDYQRPRRGAREEVCRPERLVVAVGKRGEKPRSRHSSAARRLVWHWHSFGLRWRYCRRTLNWAASWPAWRIIILILSSISFLVKFVSTWTPLTSELVL